MNFRILTFLSIGLFFAACQKSPIHQFQVKNPGDFNRLEVVSIQVPEQVIKSESTIALFYENKELAAEWIDTDGNGIVDKVSFQDEYNAEEMKTYELKEVGIQLIPKKLTQAEISIKKGGEWNGRKYEGGVFENISKLDVPAAHTDHSFFIRYEGPGWESDWAAYRFYLDWRNGVDYFGKLTEEVVLQGVGLDGFDSYHDPSDWGMDLLKVGKTLGLGSIGRFQNDSLYRFKSLAGLSCEITQNNAFYSEIKTEYDSWQTELDTTSLTSLISISAGSPFTHHEISLSRLLNGFCTGLVVGKNEAYVSESRNGYRYLVSYGPYSLNKDQIGLGLIVKEDQIELLTDGSGSHVIVFKPLGKVDYYFGAVWENGPKAIRSFEEFKRLTELEIDKISNPLINQ